MAEYERRRRRLRHPRPTPPASGEPASGEPVRGEPAGGEPAARETAAPRPPVPGPPPSAHTAPVQDPETVDERETERGLRGLVGSGASQVSLSAAMRARDAARPDDAELAAAERDLTIVRRGWVPRDDLPRTPSPR